MKLVREIRRSLSRHKASNKLYTQPVFRAFATERLASELKIGDTVHRDYISDFTVNNLGGDGAYTTQAITDTDETIVVNTKREVSMQLPEWHKIQLHLPTAKKFAQKAMNRLWNQVDADLLNTMYANATTVIDDGSIGGVAGNGINISVGNVLQVFAVCEQQLQLQNVKYVPKQYTGDVKKDGMDLMAVAAFSPQVYAAVNQFVAGKNSAKGDEVTLSAYLGYFQGFNNFVSNNLTWEGQLAMPTIPTAGDTFTLLSGVTIAGTSQALTFTFRATPSVAGDVVVANTAANGATNVKNALNAPYTTITNSASAGYVGLTQSSQTALVQYILNSTNLTASVVSSTTVKILIAGISNIPVASVFTSGNNSWTKQIQHNVFGVSQSVDLIMQKTPNLSIRPVSGKVAFDYVTWNLYGFKVFNDQKYQLLDVQVNAANFTTVPYAQWQ